MPTYSGPKGIPAGGLNTAARQAATRSVGVSVSPVRATPREIDDLARMMIAESASIKNRFGLPQIKAMQGVAEVVRNRTQSGLYPTSVSGVLGQPRQFSPMADGSFAKVTTSHPQFSTARSIAESVMAGESPPVVGGALNFGNLNTIFGPKSQASSKTKRAFSTLKNNPNAVTFADARNPSSLQHTFGTIGQPVSTVQTASLAPVPRSPMIPNPPVPQQRPQRTASIAPVPRAPTTGSPPLPRMASIDKSKLALPGGMFGQVTPQPSPFRSQPMVAGRPDVPIGRFPAAPPQSGLARPDPSVLPGPFFNRPQAVGSLPAAPPQPGGLARPDPSTLPGPFFNRPQAVGSFPAAPRPPGLARPDPSVLPGPFFNRPQAVGSFPAAPALAGLTPGNFPQEMSPEIELQSPNRPILGRVPLPQIPTRAKKQDRVPGQPRMADIAGDMSNILTATPEFATKTSAQQLPDPARNRHFYDTVEGWGMLPDPNVPKAVAPPPGMNTVPSSIKYAATPSANAATGQQNYDMPADLEFGGVPMQDVLNKARQRFQRQQRQHDVPAEQTVPGTQIADNAPAQFDEPIDRVVKTVREGVRSKPAQQLDRYNTNRVRQAAFARSLRGKFPGGRGADRAPPAYNRVVMALMSRGLSEEEARDRAEDIFDFSRITYSATV